MRRSAFPLSLSRRANDIVIEAPRSARAREQRQIVAEIRRSKREFEAVLSVSYMSGADTRAWSRICSFSKSGSSLSMKINVVSFAMKI